jgi:hypothetical protein
VKDLIRLWITFRILDASFGYLVSCIGTPETAPEIIGLLFLAMVMTGLANRILKWLYRDL